MCQHTVREIRIVRYRQARLLRAARAVTVQHALINAGLEAVDRPRSEIGDGASVVCGADPTRVVHEAFLDEGERSLSSGRR